MSKNQYTLNVKVPDESIKAFKKNGYRLCVACKVNDKTNVVWKGIEQILANNTFNFAADYQVFGAQEFATGALVKSATRPVGVSRGQTVILDENGVFGLPTGNHDPRQPITVINKYRSINIGVNMKDTKGDKYSPIFVTPGLAAGHGATTHLKPLLTIEFWFSMDFETEMMIGDVENTVGTGIFGDQDTLTFGWTPDAGDALSGGWLQKQNDPN